jgi:predicted nucleic acid-binding protein
MVRKLVDANVILRYLLRDDESLFKKASSLLEKAKTGEETVVITESALAECVYVLIKVYRVERGVVSEKLRKLLLYKGIASPDKKDLIDSVILFGKTRLSIVDCILCAKSINRGMELFTFDDELKKTAALQHFRT